MQLHRGLFPRRKSCSFSLEDNKNDDKSAIISGGNPDVEDLLKSVCKRVERRVTSRNGRVRVMSFLLSNESLSSQTIGVNAIAQSLVPKVQFNLQLPSKEKIDRAKVVLPCEHQEAGKSVQIYDGRKSLNEYVQIRPLNFIHLTCHGEDNIRLLDQLFLLAGLDQFKYGSIGMEDESRLNWLKWKRRLLEHHLSYWYAYGQPKVLSRTPTPGSARKNSSTKAQHGKPNL
ncbi:hypothetical protein Tco_0291328 [Tanacetum coccineum]